ncbi:hypothetical protein F2P81_003163 [Scophthalmus maximus]|uniref:Uncharacterized protein n=1 Tax=Scophthalmus maximus TaxID=52904 RepID=A0A6A4TFI9_SCOMX|nr:hypothetical protein F2P81_003163 [Scophthalmus maximus]
MQQIALSQGPATDTRRIHEPRGENERSAGRNVVQMNVPDGAIPGAVGAQCGRVARHFVYSAGALRGCGFKTGCHVAGSTENRPTPELPSLYKQ